MPDKYGIPLNSDKKNNNIDDKGNPIYFFNSWNDKQVVIRLRDKQKLIGKLICNKFNKYYCLLEMKNGTALIHKGSIIFMTELDTEL